jgi:hypothetical protein
MIRHHIHPDDLPLFSEDLAICQHVFDVVRTELKIEPGTDRNDLLASNIIHFYKRGIKNEAQLLILARTAAIT